jgi:hypothetical protein
MRISNRGGSMYAKLMNSAMVQSPPTTCKQIINKDQAIVTLVLCLHHCQTLALPACTPPTPLITTDNDLEPHHLPKSLISRTFSPSISPLSLTVFGALQAQVISAHVSSSLPDTLCSCLPLDSPPLCCLALPCGTRQGTQPSLVT